jgi:hypothetical protein
LGDEEKKRRFDMGLDDHGLNHGHGFEHGHGFGQGFGHFGFGQGFRQHGFGQGFGFEQDNDSYYG